jgi:thioredoxin 1
MATQYYFEKQIAGNRPVLVDFYEHKCNPCRIANYSMDEIKKAVGDEAKVLKIDLDKNPKFIDDFNIYGVPCFIIFMNGKIHWKHIGILSTAELLAPLELAISEVQ